MVFAGFYFGTEYDGNYHSNATAGRFERITSPTLPAYGVSVYRPVVLLSRRIDQE